MKRYLVGILIILTCLQPFVANALLLNPIVNASFTKYVPKISKSTSNQHRESVEAIVLDEDEEDEEQLSSTDLGSITSFILKVYFKEKPTISLFTTKVKHSNKPLFILWSVFRI